MVALPALHRAPENDGFRELLASRADVVFITGVDCFDLLSCSPEPRLFRKSVCGYKDSEFWEELRSAPGARISAVKEPVYLHNKFLYDGLDLA